MNSDTSDVFIFSSHVHKIILFSEFWLEIKRLFLWILDVLNTATHTHTHPYNSKDPNQKYKRINLQSSSGLSNKGCYISPLSLRGPKYRKKKPEKKFQCTNIMCQRVPTNIPLVTQKRDKSREMCSLLFPSLPHKTFLFASNVKESLSKG